jgi:hypothetical protein
MSIPNCLHVVADLAAKFPDEWWNAHRPSGGGPKTEAFIRRLAWVLHSTVDPRFGLNGKRGNPADISDDVVCFDGVSVLGDYDPTRGNAPVTVLDVIGSAGGPNPTPQWGPVGPSPLAAWVKPEPVGEVVAPPVVSDVWTLAHEALRARLGAMNASTLTIAQQLAHSFPGEVWGQKNAGSGRETSRDTIARKMPNGRLFGVRVLPTLHLWYILGAEQVFEPVVPVNHLGTPVVVPPVDPPPVDPPVTPVAPGDLAPVLAAIQALAAKVEALSGTVNKQRQEVLDAVRGQSYDIKATANVFGRQQQIVGVIAPRGVLAGPEAQSLLAEPEE